MPLGNTAAGSPRPRSLESSTSLARERIQAAGLSDRVTILLQDYRTLTGEYDKLVSVEMIEAVGAEYFDTFFGQCSDLLTPEGAMVLQGHRRRGSAVRAVTPLGRLHPGATSFPVAASPRSARSARRSAAPRDMRLVHLEDITPHYATTLQHWRRRLLENANEVRRLGFSDDFPPACGSSTSATVPVGSPSASSATCRWFLPSRCAGSIRSSRIADI